MALTITHTTVATGTDSGDQVSKNAWNEGHTLAGDYLRKATVTLSSADILDLHNTPKTIVAAPGSGKFLLPWRAVAVYTFGTTDYVYTDGDCELHVGSASFGQLGGLLDNGADAVYVVNPLSNDYVLSDLEDAAIAHREVSDAQGHRPARVLHPVPAAGDDAHVQDF